MPNYEKPTAKSSRVAKKVSPNAKGPKFPVYDPAAKVAEMDAETEKQLVDAAKIMAPTKGDVELAREVKKSQKDPLQKKAEENKEVINSSPYFEPGETTASHTEIVGEPSSEPAPAPEVPAAEASTAAPETAPREPASEPAAPPAPDAETERKNREEFEQAKKEFNENEEKIFKGREGVGRKWRIISSALESVGLSKRKAKDDEIKEFLEKREDLRRKLKIAGYKAFKGNERDLEAFLAEYHISAIAIRSRAEEDKLRVENSKWWSGKALMGFANVSKNYRDFISKQFLVDGKITVKGAAKGVATAAAIGMAVTSLIAASLPALGIVAVGSAGASAAAIWRGFSAVGAGYAAKKRMEVGFIESKKNEVQQDVLRQIEAVKNKTEEEWIQFIEGMEGGKSVSQEEQTFAAKDRTHRFGALAIGTGVMAFGTIMSHYVVPYVKASDTFQHLKGFVGNAWEKITHSFGGGKTVFYEPSHSPITDAEVPPKTGGTVIENTMQGSEKFSHLVKEKESQWGILRRYFLEHHGKTMLNTDGSINLKDPAVNDYFRYLQDHGKLPKGMMNHKDLSSLSPADQAKFLKIFNGRMNVYYNDALKQTIGEKMASDPKYYKSLSSEMRNLADNLDKYENFDDLPPELKKVVISDRVAANACLNKYGNSISNIPKLIAGKHVMDIYQNPNGRFTFDIANTSARSGAASSLHHAPAHGAGQAVAETPAPSAGRAAENYGRGGKGGVAESYGGRGGGKTVDTSQYDQIRESKLQFKQDIENALADEKAQLGAEANVLNEQAISGMTKANLGLLNGWLKEGVGNGFKPSTSAQEVWEGIKNLSPGITSDQPLPPTAGEMIQRGNTVRFTQEMFQRFRPLNARETMQEYMERMSRTNFYLFKALSNLTGRK